MKSLREWLGFCQHTYEVYGKGTRTYACGVTSMVIISRCSKCGKIKTKEVG